MNPALVIKILSGDLPSSSKPSMLLDTSLNDSAMVNSLKMQNIREKDDSFNI